MANEYPKAPLNTSLDERYLRILAQIINRNNDGKLNCTGDVSLAASSTSTTVNNRLMTSNSYVGLTPLTSTAANAINNIYVTSRENGSFKVMHDSSTATDRRLAYVIIG